jgi:hypothetical protein
VLRAHEVFRTPIQIDRSATVALPTPESWRPDLPGKTVDVLPLVLDRKKERESGWCTYVYEHAQAPELEPICGGINSKSPKAGAIWRQGNLLHFGFQPAPDEMNEAGRALLVNCIAYISRFTDDRVIVRTPSVFVQGKRLFDREGIARLLRQPQADVDAALRYYVDQHTLDTLKGKNRDEIAGWYKNARDYLHADSKGFLTVDMEARALSLAPGKPEFFERALTALRKPDSAAVARSVLSRYAPEGPGEDAEPQAWQAWWDANKLALFFSDTGGYRWYVDRLAKKRGLTTGSMRGAARATLVTPPLEGRRQAP